MEVFSLQILDRPGSLSVSTWWGQYEVSALLFVPTPPVLSYCGRLVLNSSTDYKTRLWTFALPDYVLLAGVMLTANSQNGSCVSYYTHN